MPAHSNRRGLILAVVAVAAVGAAAAINLTDTPPQPAPTATAAATSSPPSAPEAAAPAAVPVGDPVVGSPAPAFTGTDTKGGKVSLSDYLGRTVVLEWTNHDCPFVRKHYNSGNMQMTQRTAAADGVVWLSIISSAPGEQGHVSGAEADALTASRNARPSAVLLDPSGAIGRTYNARTTPHMFVIDPKGLLAYHGAIDSIKSADVADVPKAQNYVLTALAQMKAGQPVDPQGTRPYGCSVKYGS